MAVPIPLQEALRDSITSGTFVDTKFWVFSKRGSKSGRAGEPKALFVNGHVTKRVPRLETLLDERETEEDLRALFPTDREPCTADYDYEDDSDLEEDDEDDDDDEPSDALSQVATEKPGDNSDVASVESSDAKSNESLDIVSVSDLDSLFFESSDTKGEAGTASPTHVGKVVVIEDVAFVTFQALLRYLYTNEIEFAPWGSAERRKTRTLEKISESYGIPKPSPKSIYGLADKYDIPELKELALRQIQKDLSKCDIAEEVFSEYTSWYPELREPELRQLARVLLSPDSGPALGALKAKIKSYASGQLPHAEDVLPALYELMENDESIKETPLPAAASSDRRVFGGDWDRLKKALTSSLTSGTFLDSQFYAVESRPLTGPPKTRPVYFCSMVGGSFASKLVAYSSKFRTRRTALPRCANGYDSDIGDEKPDPRSSAECYPRSRCVRENPAPTNMPTEPALLLKSGAAKTWASIFLFVYIGGITFAPLGSRSVPSSETETQDDYSSDEETLHETREGSAFPSSYVITEPCSPKSAYCLAEKVGLTKLCDIAFKHIRSELDEDNIVQELFSPFTADHKRIREMEHELFQSELKPSVDSTLLSKIIRSSSSGENSHRTAAMEMIFERSIQERRERAAMKANDSQRPGPTPQLKRSSEGSNISIPRAESPAPAPAPQPASRPPPPKPRLTPSEAAPDPKPILKPEVTRKTLPATQSNASRHRKIAETNGPILSEDVYLGCKISGCRAALRRSQLKDGLYCRACPGRTVMCCTNCERDRTTDVRNCGGCGLRFLK